MFPASYYVEAAIAIAYAQEGKPDSDNWSALFLTEARHQVSYARLKELVGDLGGEKALNLLGLNRRGNR